MIRIIIAERTYNDQIGARCWICWLELSEDNEVLWLPAAAPDGLEEVGLQAHFDAQEPQLWRIAQQKQYQPDVLAHLRERALLRRLVKVMLGEINILREAAGLQPRTLEQLKLALRARNE